MPNSGGQTPLDLAIQWQRTDALALLLEAGADPNLPDGRKMTPLHRVADPAAVTLLLEAGADLDARDESGATPLHRAAVSPALDVVRAHIDAGAEVDAPDEHGDTPLHWSLRNWASSLPAEVLLEAGADVNALNASNETPLHAAARYSSSGTAAIAALLEAGADANARAASGETPLHLAVPYNDDIAQLHALLAGGADVNSEDTSGATPLHRAAAWQNLATVNALLEGGADINARAGNGDTPLHRAVARAQPRHAPPMTFHYNAPPQVYTENRSGYPALSGSDTALVAALVGAGADMEARNDSGETALATAARHGNDRLVSKLLELGSPPEPGLAAVTPSAVPVCDWATHTMFADAPVVSLEGCLEAGVGVSALDRRGRSPLHALVGDLTAKHYFLPAAITALIGAGADTDARDGQGATLLHQVAGGARGYWVGGPLPLPDAAAALLAGGADVNARNRGGRTPLHVAAETLFDNSFTVTVLLDAGGDVNLRDESGGTPLYRASGRSGHPAMVRLLMRAGADVDAPADNGETPLHRAAREQNPTVAALLLELGADRTQVDDSGTVADPASCRRWPDPVFFHHATAATVVRCIDSGVGVDAEARYDLVRNPSGRLESYAAGSTPLHVAAGWTRDPAVITVLLAAGADVNARNRHRYTPLHYAARDNSEPAVIAVLVAAGAEVEAWRTGLLPHHPQPGWDVTPLHEAARNESAAIAAELLDAGADVNAVAAGGKMPLHRAAAENTNPAVVTELVSRGANVNARLPGGRTPLHEAAAANRNPGILTALLKAGADVNAWGASDEVWPDRESMIASATVRDFTPWGGNVNLSDQTGIRAPLHEAVMGRGDSAVVATLIEAGADVNARGDLHRSMEPAATPLHWAASANPHPAVPELLARAGADMNARSGAGWTPLHLAALRNPTLFPILLDLGADPEAADRYGKTPMDYAVENLWLQGWEVVRPLMEEKENESGREGSDG